MSRSEIVSRFVAAIASNPSHSNETVPNIVDMAEELADEVEKRPGCDYQFKASNIVYTADAGLNEWGADNTYPNRLHDIKHNRTSAPAESKKTWFVAPVLQTITLVLCGVVIAGVLIYGFINACRWVWNFYS